MAGFNELFIINLCYLLFKFLLNFNFLNRITLNFKNLILYDVTKIIIVVP